MFALRLYIAGLSPKCVRAIDNLKHVCEEHLAGRYSIEVIDLLVQPQLASGDEIVAVPTLVRQLPQPIRRIIGDLSDTEKVLVGLQLRQRSEAVVTDDQLPESPPVPIDLAATVVRQWGLSAFGGGGGERAADLRRGPRRAWLTSRCWTSAPSPNRCCRTTSTSRPPWSERWPEPVRRLVGDLSDADRVRQALEIEADPMRPARPPAWDR